MPTARAHVTTDRARRYLDQLCGHVSKMNASTHHRPNGHAGGESPRTARRAESSGSHGIIELGSGRCTLQASDRELVLVAEAGSPQDLDRLTSTIGTRLEGMGRRDDLTVTWNQSG